MPKRKKDDNYEHLLKKLQKLDKKIRRQCKSRSRSPSSENRYHSNSQERNHSSQIMTRPSDDCVADLHDVNHNDTDYPEALSVPTAEPVTESAIGQPRPSTSIDAGITTSVQDSSSGEEHDMLNDGILKLLGDDPTVSNTYGPNIQKDLAIRLEYTARHGLSKEIRRELMEKYLLPSNCTLIDAPALNAEMKAAISEMTAKRDKSIEFRQKQNATAISCVSQAINKLFSHKDADPVIIKSLVDAERLLCDLQHHDSTVRRSFILTSVKKEMKDQLQNTKPDNLLFGQNLAETLKMAKTISKSGADLKIPTTKPPQTVNKKPTPSNSKNLNWKGPYPPRKQPYQNNPKTKEPPPPQNRSRHYSSSRPSQQQQTRGRR